MAERSHEGIAIIGMAGRFPGAENVTEFWDNLVAGKEAVSFFSDSELTESGLDPAALRKRGNYVPARGILKDADCFDAAFFGVHPKEAEVMDPQQRVFLEACWSALENAGYAPNRMEGIVGVFGGSTFNTYYLHALHPRPDLIDLVGSEQVMFGNEKDYLASRVAYKFGLKGPAINVSTACSTSLVAVCQACQSLLTYQCDVALAGGVSVTVPQKRGYFHDEGNIGSADGHTRTFDANASGTVFGNGVAVVTLKRLEDAVRDNDQVYAVIKGAALNNDGSQRVSFGAPGVEGQASVVAMAHALAGWDPETISYVEAHGTATPLGDPIEVAGLTKAFRLGTEARQFCALGSVKSNVGHLDVAAGVTGLIKIALMLRNKLIPATLHFVNPNPKLELESSPFYVAAKLQPWQSKPGVPLRAGVSSFGTGGTNAHVVVEEAPELTASGLSRPWQLLPLSAKTPDALQRASENLAAHLTKIGSAADPQKAAPDLADAAFTLQTGRAEFAQRQIVVCQDAKDGATALAARDPRHVYSHRQSGSNPPVVFMFPGQGAQYAGMGAELYRSEPVFRAEVDRCATLLEPLLKTDLRKVMFPAAGEEKKSEELLVQTRFTQPALFTIEYALAKQWMSWGIRPAAMIGHSVGEYVAGCLAGVFELEDAVTLVARRGALVQAQPGGAMLAVRLPERDVAARMNGHLSIAAINAPSLCVVSGPYEAIAELESRLSAEGVVTRHLNTSHAFHSAMMEPVVGPFLELLRKVKLGEPNVPYVSNVTAKWVTTAEARNPEYWSGHVRDTVRFAEGVAELMRDPRNILLEVGPGHTLSQLARQHPAKAADQISLSSLPYAGAQELRGLLEAVGRLWMAGVAVDWDAFYAYESRRRAALPAYPFERKRYWPESPVSAQVAPSTATTPAQLSATPALASPPQTTPLLDSPVLPPVIAEPGVPRKDRLIAAVRSLLQELTGYDLSGVDVQVGLLELGLDSLLLTQAAQLLQRKFGASLTFRQLMEEVSSMAAIASYLDEKMAPDAPAAAGPTAPTPVSVAEAGVPSGIAHNPALEQLWRQQQQLTNQLQQLLVQQSGATPRPSFAQAPATSAPTIAAAGAPQLRHGPFRPIEKGASQALSPAQSGALQELIARYTKRTATSKKLAAENRSLLADPRSVSGFNRLWKEMVYPISTTRSEGSKVWDVDGNDYVDFVMGFGASLFGHRPSFVGDAVREQLDRGFEIGPIQPLAGEVAALMRDFTGMQRFGFTNTGSEAVLAATRVARTVTGRDKIAVFAGAYHGIFDEVLFRPHGTGPDARAAAIAPGIPSSALDQVLVLEYGSPQALDILRDRGSEIAAVLVETVQSRRLDFQPKDFLQELRRVTEQAGSALIFDEVVTGFRIHPGGAQAHFGIHADLATYGKVIGGGLPIGVVAGGPKFMDALDGGQWQYGDTSFPEVGVTFFAGTFVRHPLALAAAKAVLTHLKQQGPGLQEGLNNRTAQLARDLRAIFEEFDAPYQLSQFSSLMYLAPPHDQRLAGLLFYLLRHYGIHTWENRLFVLTTAHTDEDLGRFTRSLRTSLEEMRSSEFLAPSKASVARSETTWASTAGVEPGKDWPPPQRMADGAEIIPLTDAQKEVWLATQMGGDASVAFNESLKLDFRGAFDMELFRTAVRHVVGRHPILLAGISPDGQSQRVAGGATPEVPLLDFSRLGEKEGGRALAGIIEREVTEPFDLVTGPLTRVRVVRLAADHHVAAWTCHHIICDGWSFGVLISELAEVYTAGKNGVVSKLDAPASFREYALASQSDSPDGHAALAYWRQRFATIPPPLDLPLDRPRPAIRSAKAASVRKDLAPVLHQAVKRVAGQNRVTQVVMLMAALKTLLHRLTGQTDVAVGLGAAGQALTGKTSMVGHCVNLLPIRTQLDSAASFKENLLAVKKEVLDALEHQQCTLGRLLQHIRVPRSASRPPLLEVIFNVDRDPGAAEFAGLELSCERNPKRALHFDLFFNFVEGPRGLYVECDYNTDLFDAETIIRWLKHYQTLLESIVSNPNEVLGKLALLTAPERHELTVEWNHGDVALGSPGTLVEWFETQAGKTPNAPALTFEGKHLSYSELNRRANQLASFLRKNDTGPEKLIGLLVERSFEMIVAILGILKAGAAYLPIDPVYPAERIAFMLEDAGAQLLLTQSSLVSLVHGSSAKVVCLDQTQGLLDEEPDSNPPQSATPENLAYAIYTSGSTGKPKGTLVTHHNVTRLMQATEPWYGFGDKDVWTLFHSQAFDFSVWEMWGALLYGGRLVIVPHLTTRSPAEFYQLLVDEQVTVLNQTPSAFKMLIQTEEDAGARGSLALRYVIFGGEALEMYSLKPWFDRHGDQRPRLINMYGITETTVHVTYRPLSAADLKFGSVLGVPIPDLQVYVLDPYQQPVPIGVTGEIHVGGAGVARGYLNREELTRQKFLPDTFTNKPGARLYRSGDLARYLPGRDIEYLGRIDQQVKLRGFRVELGEIEEALSRHAAVRQCVVVAREDRTGDKVLAAYFEARAGAAPETSALRAHLKKELPEYMVPSFFVHITQLPLTPNGKIDRNALSALGKPVRDEKHTLVAPGDAIEQVLVQLWSRVLKTRVGLHDNFFEVGGHSLLAVRIMAELEKLYQRRLPLATLIQAPTIAGLAEVLRRENWSPSWRSLVSIRPGGSRPPLFLLHSHGGNILEYYPLANHLDADQPVYGVQARGLDGQIEKGRSIEEMAVDYLKEIRSLQPEGPYYLAGFCFGGLLAFEAARQLSAAGEDVGWVAMIQTLHPAEGARFNRETSLPQQWWYRASKRLTLERENLLNRGASYFMERGRRVWDMTRARTAMAFDHLTGNSHDGRKSRPLHHVLEALSIEHNAVYERYRSRAYQGDVVLFRARKQLEGLNANSDMGWSGLVSGRLEVCDVPGHQQNMLVEPNVSHLAREFAMRLCQAQQEHKT